MDAAHLPAQRLWLAWIGGLLAVIAFTTAATLAVRDAWQQARLSGLQTTAERLGNELMSLTISGSLMGAVSLLGLTNEDLRNEGLSRNAPNTPRITRLFETIGQAFGADGVFVASADGIIRGSWNAGDTPSTGLNIRFRPYFQVAMQGIENIYAAISMSSGQRGLYFAAPIYPDPSKNNVRVGTVVARAPLNRIDDLLKGGANIALLISPQGIIFGGNRPAWIAQLVDEPTPERLKTIRELKQFGNLFETSDPIHLPLPVSSGVHAFEDGIYAVAITPVQWNDPSGDWRLILMEDLSQTIPATRLYGVVAVCGTLALTVLFLLLHLRRIRWRQNLANLRIRELANAQEALAAQKDRIASVSLRLQQTQRLEDMSRIFLSEAHALLGMMQGVIYALDDTDDDRLRLIASFACDAPPAETIAVGDGLLGQCARERRQMVVEVASDASWRIRSGLGEAAPGCVVLAPVELNRGLLGVIEIALSRVPDDDQQACLDMMLPVLAMNLEINRHRRTMEQSA